MDKNTRYFPLWALRRVLVLSWAWVFLIAQIAVLAHGVVHPEKGDHHGAGSRARANESKRAHAHDATKGLQHAHISFAEDGADENWVLRGLRGNADSPCELFDAAGQSFVSSGAYGTPRFVVPNGALLADLSGEALARWAGLLNARGPPASA